MKSINSRFVVSNIVTSIILILSIPLLENQQNKVFHETDMIQGVFILFVFILGLFLRIKKSRDIARNVPSKKLNVIEKIFLTLFFIFGISTSINFTFGSFSYMYGKLDYVPDTGKVFQICLMMFSFFVLFYEVYMVSGEANPKLAKQTKWLDPLYSFYIGIAIAFSWDVMIVGGHSKLFWGMENFWSEFIATICLALMFIMSVQRLFWYELFKNSSGWKDNLKVLASFTVVLASAITPLFFK